MNEVEVDLELHAPLIEVSHIRLVSSSKKGRCDLELVLVSGSISRSIILDVKTPPPDTLKASYGIYFGSGEFIDRMITGVLQEKNSH